MKKEFYVIAHNIRSLLNVGSFFRTADAFGITKIYLTGYTGTPQSVVHQNKITKTALGAEKFVPWEYNKSAARVIKKLRSDHKGIIIVGLENNLPKGVKAKTFAQLKKNKPLALVLGEEVSGIGKPLLKLCDAFIEIPMKGKKESLNVSVAFGIAAYELSKT